MSEPSEDANAQGAPVHRPVLVREVFEFLDLKPGLTVVDGTVGAGGHGEYILKAIGPTGRLIGLDRDPFMLELAGRRLRGENVQLIHASYAQLTEVLADRSIDHVDRVLLDLGLSSDQLADDARGFGFDSTGLLDLRFDTSTGQPAWQLLQTLSEGELEHVFKIYGEEPHARAVARLLVRLRATQPVRTGAELSAAVCKAARAKYSARSRRHPATRVFQALRIAVNRELEHLERALAGPIPNALGRGGRAVIITFHSLEDRLVKQAFRDPQLWQNLTHKPVLPTNAEIRVNPRSRSAKLRAAARI